MNNKVLFLNRKNIKEILVLDEACDAPGFANWDSNISCGEIPYVIYEALEDYWCWENKELLQDKMSEKFLNFMNDFIKKNEWEEDDIYEMIHDSIIYFTDGTQRIAEIDFDWLSDITDNIQQIYEFGEDLYEDDVWKFCDLNGTEVILNLDNVSMVELPLVSVNNAILKELNNIE